MKYPVEPTDYGIHPYQHEWFHRDFLHSPDGVQEFPNHHCKLSYIAAKPFATWYRNAVDIGCRDGEFAHYLQADYAHTYCFDPRKRKLFPYNVEKRRVTHFTCALGDEVTDIYMYAGTHKARDGRSASKVPCFKLDDFDLKDIDFIKIDVEGFERKVLIGAEKTILRDRPLIVIEQNDVRLDGEPEFAAKTWLEERGYTHVATDPRGWDYIMHPGG